MAICDGCEGLAHIGLVHQCQRCKKTSDEDPYTLMYCTACARELNVCQSCGKKLIEAEADHTRDLCGKPDVPDGTPRHVVEVKPAHCLCCGSKMSIHECISISMQQLGMYVLSCPTCPSLKTA